MGRKRKKEENIKKREEHDTTYWANKTDKFIASLTTEERDLINFLWPIINNTIDQKTNNLKLHVLDSETEKEKYKDELKSKLGKEIKELTIRWQDAVQEGINSYIKTRDSPREI